MLSHSQSCRAERAGETFTWILFCKKNSCLQASLTFLVLFITFHDAFVTGEKKEVLMGWPAKAQHFCIHKMWFYVFWMDCFLKKKTKVVYFLNKFWYRVEVLMLRKTVGPKGTRSQGRFFFSSSVSVCVCSTAVGLPEPKTISGSHCEQHDWHVIGSISAADGYSTAWICIDASFRRSKTEATTLKLECRGEKQLLIKRSYQRRGSEDVWSMFPWWLYPFMYFNLAQLVVLVMFLTVWIHGNGIVFFFILAENNVANAVRHYPPLSSLMKIRSRRVFMCHGILCNVL